MSTNSYAVICQGGTTPITSGTHSGCVLPADSTNYRPTLASIPQRSDLIIYHSVFTEGQNFYILEVARKYLLLLFYLAFISSLGHYNI